jgi:CubicO group peptidase (beta-lactamase class C family)
MFRSTLDYLADTYLVCPPGTMFYYSNSGVNLLGIIIEIVTGMSFHQYIEKILLNDLGMTSSAIILTDELKYNLSKPYNKGKEQVEPLMKDIPPGGIFSTANDMAKFMMSIINGAKGFFKNETSFENQIQYSTAGI